LALEQTSNRKEKVMSEDTLVGKDQCTLIPPLGVRIHTVHISFEPDRDWQDAVNTVGPDTPRGYGIWTVGYRYPPTGTGIIKRNIILLNFADDDGDWDRALACAQSMQLKGTIPREVLAIGEQCPNLHMELNQVPLYVFSMSTCVYTIHALPHACCVYWDTSKREARLHRIRPGDLIRSEVCRRAWFAFHR